MQLCRFYLNNAEFKAAIEAHRDPVLSDILPPLLTASDKQPPTTTPSGYTYPPYIAVERGTSLKEWPAETRSSRDILGLLEGLATALWGLHAAGFVHRDLRPANVVLLPSSNAWKMANANFVAAMGTLLSSLDACVHGLLIAEVTSLSWMVNYVQLFAYKLPQN